MGRLRELLPWAPQGRHLTARVNQGIVRALPAGPTGACQPAYRRDARATALTCYFIALAGIRDGKPWQRVAAKERSSFSRGPRFAPLWRELGYLWRLDTRQEIREFPK